MYSAPVPNDKCLFIWLMKGVEVESPQKEDGYTAIANEIMDALARFRIPGECWQVLAAILRKTYGWRKSADWIPHSQLVEMTGMDKGNVCRALSKLTTHNLIVKSDNNKIGLQKRYSQWIPFGVVKSDGVSKVTIPVVKSDNKVLSEVTDSKASKETYSKTMAFDEEPFTTFYKAYPKKRAPADARRAWSKIKNPPLDLILKAIKDQKQTNDWQKYDGQFIPYPATWLNDRRWEDEIPPPKAPNYGAEIAEILKRGRKHRRTDESN